MLATNQQAMKGELLQEMAKKVECGVPCEIKREDLLDCLGEVMMGD